ncbi:MAG: alpha/beta hydrolase [Flavobacteriaceae bacterium]|nr:alpha/beta hydrolase [Flavobacteriaceae bacterium]
MTKNITPKIPKGFEILSGLINYKNTDIHYKVQGKGNAIVLLHGFLENSSMWNKIIPHLAKKNRVICIDLLGHGKSGNLGYIHTMKEQAQMVKAVLNHLRLRKYILIGHSMGGYIALAFAELYPQHIKGLCLMNSTALPDTKEKKINRDRAIVTVKKNHKTFIRLAIPNLFSEENKTKFAVKIKQITQEALLTSQQGIIAALEGMKIRKDHTKLYKISKFSIQMIIGKKDPVLDYSSLILQIQTTKVKVVEFPDGHMSHFENKDALIVALKSFARFCN